jgi:hypothetical protein
VIRQCSIIFRSDVVIFVENRCLLCCLILILIAYMTWAVRYEVPVIAFIHQLGNLLFKTIGPKRGGHSSFRVNFPPYLRIKTAQIDHYHALDLAVG